MKKFFLALLVILSFAAVASAANFDKEYTCRVGKLWGFPGENVTFRISDTNIAEIIRRTDGQFCIRPKKAGDFIVEATFKNSDGTISTQIYLLHAVEENSATPPATNSETFNAANFDKEYTCRVGKLWGFPGENVTFRISDTNLAEIIRRTDGQFCIRPKAAGDFIVEATFRNSDGSTTTQLYLMHAVGENLNTLLETDYAEKVLQLVNIERKKNNLQPLTLAKDLSECAVIRANETVKKFSHTRPDGQNFNTVAEKGTYKKIGENINGGAKSAEQVVYEWMHSPAHRENILYPHYNEMGVACIYAADSKYKYYWVQWFRLR